MSFGDPELPEGSEKPGGDSFVGPTFSEWHDLLNAKGGRAHGAGSDNTDQTGERNAEVLGDAPALAAKLGVLGAIAEADNDPHAA